MSANTTQECISVMDFMLQKLLREYKMSFKIENTNGVYLVDIGTGVRYCANDLQEVVFALQHYFKESLPSYPYDYHFDNAGNNKPPKCPLCESERG
jgi:hypothetical protein